MRKQERLRKQSPPVGPGRFGRCTRHAYTQWQRDKIKQWKSLPDIQKRFGFERASADFLAQRTRTAGTAVPSAYSRYNTSSNSVVRTVVDDLGACKSVFAASTLEAVARHVCGVSEGDPAPGFTRYEPPLREKLLEESFVVDQHGITRA